MTDKCVWEPEDDSARAWFYAKDHAGEDSEDTNIQHVWAFCPYCGKPIEFQQS